MSTKRCSRCKVEKPYSDFTLDRSRPDGYSYHCRDCRRPIHHNTYKLHHPDAVYRGENSGTFDRNEYSKQYRKSDLARNAAYAAKRRAAKLQATPKWYEKQQVEEVYREAERISNETGDPHQVDHIVPLLNPNVCGLHCLANLQVLTEEANLKKNNTF